MSLKKIALLTALPFIAMAQGAWAQPAGDLPPPAASVSAIQQGGISSEAAVRASLARIEALNHQGPKLNAVIAISPKIGRAHV